VNIVTKASSFIPLQKNSLSKNEKFLYEKNIYLHFSFSSSSYTYYFPLDMWFVWRR